MTTLDSSRLLALYEAVCRLHTSLELSEVLERALIAAYQLMDADRGFFIHLNEIAELVYNEHGWPVGYKHLLRITPNVTVENLDEANKQIRALVDKAKQTKQCMLIEDTLSDPLFVGEPAACYFASRTVLIAPLPMQEPIGVLFLDRATNVGLFTTHDLDLLESFAKQVGVAIHNAQLHERAKAASSEFISTLTGDLYSPITMVKGYADLLLANAAGPVDDKQKEFLLIIRRNVEKIGKELFDSLDIIRVERGLPATKIETANIVALVQESLNDLRARLESKGQILNLSSLDVPDVLADHRYLRRVLDCLIDNACRYTPSAGQITVSAEAQDKYVRISVSDTGIGIDPQDQNRIFTRFFRGATSDVGQPEGVGLSLYLAKSFVERMGGTIGFESELGKGSTFWFTLPIATVNE